MLCRQQCTAVVFSELTHGLASSHIALTEKRTRDGAVPVEIRLAVALRMFAGGSEIDIAVVLFGISKESVFNIMWQVVDGIINTPEVGPFFFPQTVDECTRQAERWKVCTTCSRDFVPKYSV